MKIRFGRGRGEEGVYVPSPLPQSEFKVRKLDRWGKVIPLNPTKLKGHRRDINLIPVSELITILIQHQSKECE